MPKKIKKKKKPRREKPTFSKGDKDLIHASRRNGIKLMIMFDFKPRYIFFNKDTGEQLAQANNYLSAWESLKRAKVRLNEYLERTYGTVQ